MNEKIDFDVRQLVHDTLSTDAYLQVNKKLIKLVGTDTSIFLSDIISKEKYFYNRSMLDPDGYFFNTQDNVEKDTTLSPYQQRRCIQTLIELGIIMTKREGLPARTFIKIMHTQLLSFLTSSSEETSHHNNNNTDNKISSYDDIKASNDAGSDKKKKIVTESVYITEWNKRDHLSKHIKPDTKVFQTGHKYCRYLKNGNAKLLGIDKQFLARNNIPVEWLSKKWSDAEIFESFDRLSLSHTDAYMPVDKKMLPKNLPDFIYNWRVGGISWFLLLMNQAPKLRSDLVVFKDINPEITAIYKAMFDKFNVKKIQSQSDMNKLIRSVATIRRRHDEILPAIEANGPGAKTHFGKLKSLAQHHATYLMHRFEDKISVADMTRTWTAFMSYIKSEFKYDFTITGDELEKKQKEQKRRDEETMKRYI